MQSTPAEAEVLTAVQPQARGAQTGLSSVSEGLDIIGDIWMLRLLSRLMIGIGSWSGLCDGLNISPTTLSTRLKQLEEAGCIVREKSYSLTERGLALFPVLVATDEWKLTWDNPHGNLLSPWDHSCGAPLRCRSICRHCRQAMPIDSVRFEPNEGTRPRVEAASRHFRNAQSAVLPMEAGNAVPSRILQVLGDRRASRLSAGLSRGNARFEDLQTWTKLHPAIVSERLRKLQLLGLAHMRLYQENPDRYYYAASAEGRDFYAPTQYIMQWADRWIFEGEVPPVRVVHEPCGSFEGSMLVCSSCDGVVCHDNVHLARPEIEPLMI